MKIEKKNHLMGFVNELKKQNGDPPLILLQLYALLIWY